MDAIVYFLNFFFFSSRRRHTRFKCDWSSDVCSSDLNLDVVAQAKAGGETAIDLPFVLCKKAELLAVDVEVAHCRHTDLQAVGIGARVGAVEIPVACREGERTVQGAGIELVER